MLSLSAVVEFVNVVTRAVSLAVQFLATHRFIWACLSQDINEFDFRQFTKRFFFSGKRWGGGMKRILFLSPMENFVFEINL